MPAIIAAASMWDNDVVNHVIPLKPLRSAGPLRRDPNLRAAMQPKINSELFITVSAEVYPFAV
jgi:hypothetical protein